MRVNFKISLTVLTFAFFVILIISAGFFAVKSNWSSLNIGQSIGSAIYIVNDENETIAQAQPTTTVALKASELVSTQALDDIYLNSLLKYLPMIILAVCSAILVLTMTLWFVLRRIYTKQMISIIHDLQFLEKFSEDKVEDKTVAKAFKQLKDKFDGNLADYKRLSSYLTHEQKNAIAILRANLELEHNETGNLHILDRLTDSIDDILTLSNSSEEAMSEKVDVSLICAEVCDTYRKSYPELTFSFDEIGSTLILGKNRWIYRAVSNLVDNAIKYGNEKPIEVAVNNRNGSVIVEITDHGKGIDPEVHTTIFNHNYRINGLKQDGYGIGLSVVSHVCDLCQGFVYVESKKNQGSTFYLSFPQIAES
ncbi:histidine kinase [Enterococcus plantarum]|uniref:histidine kinase n=1 Tax=Enterococcus plantarum TaxID=1077675 RepID=A0A2W3ZC40_9ENTE|nr:HAMP domain-containing sensor histidine kinase [Enterococcus plantarum]MBO0466953.1 HAMP domain-containing histidine kinase [Enterococcus plantarum]OEG18512.1 histidine kinase [Enterococcus plantarum]PZL74800.1 sensor histidine kinase [Enterococcus plantarum]